MPRRTKKPSAYELALQQVQEQTPQTTEDEAEQLDSQTAEHLDVQTARQPDSETSEHSDIQTSKRLDSRTARQQRIKATFYLAPDDIVAIDTMQTAHFRKSGKKPEKSKLVSEAIQLLFRQLDSIGHTPSG